MSSEIFVEVKGKSIIASIDYWSGTVDLSIGKESMKETQKQQIYLMSCIVSSNKSSPHIAKKSIFLDDGSGKYPPPFGPA